jgi:FtsZ-interacting cell division protein ZipA
MAFLDFIRNRNASPQQPVAQNTQPQAPPAPTVQSLPAEVKAQAVEAARPAAELMDKATQHQNASSAPSQVTPSSAPSKGRGLGMER